jgi:DNA uptake protein ComE-like DNA-binding protein
MSAPDSARPFAAPDERGDGLAPDPDFWGADDRAARQRRRRPRRTGLGSPAGGFGARGDRRAVLAIAAVVAVTAALVSYRAASPPAATPTAAPAATATPTPGAGAHVVVVHVAGAVSRPGVVELPAGDRVVDALDAAGGALTSADLDRLNLAARLRDGEQVLVPTGTPSPTATTSTTVPVPTTVAPG